ncbi:MAG: Stk1 family PASTA domain-containing Ser/Thr kinase [Oscillospiraceae bacterium]|nr:Stk1 family PASTA domain-containing Ser/Thr kinase [Oscillospiraceae bacterium]
MDNNDKYLGRILDNRYEILELIGIGGMAYVYKALCHRLNRLVAIKILKEDLANDEEFQRRFYTESQAVAMLSHPNIVGVYDVSRSGNTEYIVMELIEGITLKQYINRKGLLNWKEALHFATQITKALAHAHSRGIIHRDIKPHNIMILKDGSVKVADFGIARLLSVQNTLTQEALGSVHYISPEQAKGGQIDARSDIYSVGVVMYEMLTSRLPFVGESAVSVAIQHISAIPLSPRDINPDIPLGLEEITMHAMEPDVNIRFTTADEMLNDLEEFRKHPGIVFNYTISNPAERQSADLGAPYETRVIPREPLARPANRPMPQGPGRAKPEMTANEYRDSKRKSSNTATLVGIFAVVLFLVVLLAVFILPPMNTWFSPSDEEIPIPRFEGRKYEDLANDDDYSALFDFIPTFIANDDVDEGVVISQSPDAGTMHRAPMEGNRIRIRLDVSSGGTPPVEMPQLVGLHRIEARNKLESLRLELDIEMVPVESDQDKDVVVETTPRAGANIARGNSVQVMYSLGPDRAPVRVPTDLEGRTQAAVESILRDLDLIVDASTFEDNTPAGTVFHVANAGELVQPGSTIRISVSTGPAATPPPETPTPTPTPNYTVTVVNGSGSGSFFEGVNVQIIANAAPAGQQFKEWIISPAVDFTAGSATSTTAAFTMPASPVNVTAVFEALPQG